ncbi:chemokine (C motif) receptor 1a, duplicate 1 [Denticeps clupeoides]|nr:chemokine XC receptor 1-like [Denticeps clupeoides]
MSTVIRTAPAGNLLVAADEVSLAATRPEPEPDYSTSNDYCDKSDVVRIGSVATVVFFSGVIAFSLLGNTLVLVVLVRFENLRSATNSAILNLALSDLLFTLGLPFWASYHLRGWTLGEASCKAVSLVFHAGFYSGVLSLTLMTVQRYLAVVHPLSDRGEARWPALVVWAVSLAAAAPALRSTVQEHEGRFYCEYDAQGWKTLVVYQQNILFLAAFLVMAFCYTQILRTILRSPANKRIRTVKLIFSIVVLFFVGWAPYNVLIFLTTIPHTFTCDVSKRLDFTFYVCRLVAFSHCCLNPVFYVFVGVKFRRHLKVLLQKILPARPASVETQPTRLGLVPSQGSMY